MGSDFINGEDIKRLKYLIQEAEISYYEYTSDYSEDIDYEDLRKRIFNIQCEIKAIAEKWAE